MSKAEAKSKDTQHGPIHYPLWFGGSASCFAACVTHPLDLSKSRDHWRVKRVRSEYTANKLAVKVYMASH